MKLLNVIPSEAEGSYMKYFLKNKIISANLILALTLNIITWLFIYWKIPKIAEDIPLHYNIYFGVDLLGPWYKIFVIPATGIFVLLVNLILAYIIYKREKLISYFLVWSTTLVQVLLLIAAVMIALINL